VQGQPFGLGILNAETTIQVAVAWDYGTPEDVQYYSIYVSTVQGQFDKPYARITKLPTNGSPVMVSFPADGVTRYMIVRAKGAGGESENSNQITFTPSLTWSDLN